MPKEIIGRGKFRDSRLTQAEPVTIPDAGHPEDVHVHIYDAAPSERASGGGGREPEITTRDEDHGQEYFEGHAPEDFTGPGERDEREEESDEDWQENALHIASFSPRSRFDVRRERDTMHILRDDRPYATFRDPDGETHVAVPSKADDALHIFRRPRRDRRDRRRRDSSASSRASSIGLQRQLDDFWARPENHPPREKTATIGAGGVRDGAPAQIKTVADLQRAADELWKRGG